MRRMSMYIKHKPVPASYTRSTLSAKVLALLASPKNYELTHFPASVSFSADMDTDLMMDRTARFAYYLDLVNSFELPLQQKAAHLNNVCSEGSHETVWANFKTPVDVAHWVETRLVENGRFIDSEPPLQ